MNKDNENSKQPEFPLYSGIDSKEAGISQLILDSSPLAVIVLDCNNDIIDCNGSAVRLFEASSKDEVIKSFFMFSTPIQSNGMFSGEYAREMVLRAAESGEMVADWTYRSKGGAVFPGETTFKRIKYYETYITIIYIRDLRAEFEAQAEVKEVTERNKIMIDATPIGFVFFDDSFQIVDCNPAALALFGLSDAGEFAEGFYTFSPERQKDGSLSIDTFKHYMQIAFNDGSMNFEWDHLTHSGEALPVDVTFIRVEYKGSYRLAGYFRDLREYRAMLAEMKLTEQQLRQAKERAEDSSRTKSEFLANMSHEIRTPMNGIVGITSLAMRNETSEAQRKYLQKIDESAKSLLRIINDILDFSKIEAGRLEIEKSEFRIETIISDIRNVMSYSLSEKSIEMSAYVSDQIDFNVVGDPLRLHQVLLNITSNAVKFTERGYITINVDVTDRKGDTAELLFTVSDSGIGMTEDQVSKVFDAFGQADSSTTRKYGGTGLGLAICKNLVELMGGRIWLESEIGVGTVFFFTARFETVAGRELSAADSYSESEFVVPSEFLGSRILLVEDNEINQLIANEVLCSAGFKVEIAGNGVEAVKMAAESEYSLILMDVQMPEMDGLTATAIIRSNEKSRHVPIVAMTANAMQGDKERSIEAGMNDHITKPLNPRFLLETICHWLYNAMGLDSRR